MDISSEEKDTLLKWLSNRIKKNGCTPFLGAGACHGMLPLAHDIANKLASRHRYPMRDPCDLARVAEFIAVQGDAISPKEEFIEEIQNYRSSDPEAVRKSREVLNFLAQLDIPLYITTNYDYSMEEALKEQKRNFKTEYFRWNKYIQDLEPSIFDPDSEFVLSSNNPVVFHLHGHMKLPESLVLTEDDYINFLISINQDPNLVPLPVSKAFASTTLLFLGYRLTDWNFRVVFLNIIRKIEKSIARKHISVQIVLKDDIVNPEKKDDIVSPEDEENLKVQVKKYLDSYFQRYEIKIFWDTCYDFIERLKVIGGFGSIASTSSNIKAPV